MGPKVGSAADAVQPEERASEADSAGVYVVHKGAAASGEVGVLVGGGYSLNVCMPDVVRYELPLLVRSLFLFDTPLAVYRLRIAELYISSLVQMIEKDVEQSGYRELHGEPFQAPYEHVSITLLRTSETRTCFNSSTSAKVWDATSSIRSYAAAGTGRYDGQTAHLLFVSPTVLIIKSHGALLLILPRNKRRLCPSTLAPYQRLTLYPLRF